MTDRLDKAVDRLDSVIENLPFGKGDAYGLNRDKARDVLRELLQVDRLERELAHRTRVMKGLGPEARLVYEAIASGHINRPSICAETGLNELLVDRKLTGLRMAGLLVHGRRGDGRSAWAIVE